MRKYLDKSMNDLASDLRGGLLRLRKGYVDAAETLIRIIDPGREYPYEFVVYRITGYRRQRSGPASEPMTGEHLRRDLQTLMLDLSDSFELRCDDYAEPTHDVNSVARRFSVSVKTVQRWRNRGLLARRLVFADGKRRIGFLETSIQWFVSQRAEKVRRSTRFSRLTDSERRDMIRRARRMVADDKCSASEVVRRLSVVMGRAAETIRYSLHKHDREFPEDAIFSGTVRSLDDEEKADIYRSFLGGVATRELSARFHRTRGSIYRVVNEVRAKHLKERPINYIHNQRFDLSDADEVILASPKAKATLPLAQVGAVSDLPPYLRDLYSVPLLNREDERDLFRRYNYLKYKADKERQAIDVRHAQASLLKEVEELLLQANVTKNRIVRANLRLVVSIAKKHLAGPQTLYELVSDGNVSLMRAVENFDYARGFRFSTYASWAIMRNFARSVPKEINRTGMFTTGHEEVLNMAASLHAYDPEQVNLSELRESLDALLTKLQPRERSILVEHYGLGQGGQTKTLKVLGKEMHLSKERVRQIEFQALEKLRRIVSPEGDGFLT